jgi:hypothetical protein
LKSGIADLFWKIEGKKEAHSTRAFVRTCAVVMIPIAAKDRARF